MVCQNCFTQISESNIVADVTFQEDSRGAATVQGGFISEGARHARTLGSAAYRRVGGGEKNAGQEAEATARRTLAQWCPRLGIPEAISNQAVDLYALAYTNGLTGGRRVQEVVAACLFAVCRRRKDNTTLLIDIAELIKINVFRLGEVYKVVCDKLYLTDENGNIAAVGIQHLVDVESLIHKYCNRLEFGSQTHNVVRDATMIVKRMKRDWIVTGRHPAGLCGACIILAARMNNFKRTVREVVYVAKVADITIAKRVEEFRRTKSAAMTVEQFRKDGLRLKHQHDPPILYESRIKKRKFEERKQMRQEASVAREMSAAVIDISDDEDEDEDEPSSRETSVATATPAPEQDDGTARRKRRKTGPTASVTAPTQGPPRRDADGFVIPALPVDPALTGAEDSQQPQTRKRGRPKKQIPQPIVITEEELLLESELEKDMGDEIQDEDVLEAGKTVEEVRAQRLAEAEEAARVAAAKVKHLVEQEKRDGAEKTRTRRNAEGIVWWDDISPPQQDEEVTRESLEIEFANDPEVINCRLTPEEQTKKEQIWLHFNEDWLRQQAEKHLLDEVAKGRNEQGKKKGAKSKPRKRKGRRGGVNDPTEAANPMESPADANKAMIEENAPKSFSNFIDYDRLSKIYAPSQSSKSTSRMGSETPSTPATPSTSARADAQESRAGSPTPFPRPDRLQSPPQTQRVAATATSPTTPRRVPPASPQVPASPPQTQVQDAADADVDEESEGDEGDYIQYRSGAGTPDWGGEDDREDIGEDDYYRATDPTSRTALGEDAYEDEFY